MGCIQEKENNEEADCCGLSALTGKSIRSRGFSAGDRMERKRKPHAKSDLNPIIPPTIKRLYQKVNS